MTQEDSSPVLLCCPQSSDKDHEEKAARVVQEMIESVRKSKKTDVKLTYKGASRRNEGVR